MDDLKNAIVHEEVLARKFMPATMTLFQRLEKQDEDTGAFLTKNLIDFATETSSSLKQNLKTKTQEKLPPRLNIKSINIAVRCFGHEIRHFTYQNTGKDLANLRYSCPDLLKKIGEVTRRSKKTLSETASFFNLSLPGEISKTSGLLTEGGDLDLSSLREHLLQCRPGPQTELPTSEEISEAVVNNLQVNNVCSGSTSNKIGTNGNASLNSTVSVSSYPWQVERITDHDLTRYFDEVYVLRENICIL